MWTLVTASALALLSATSGQPVVGNAVSLELSGQWPLPPSTIPTLGAFLLCRFLLTEPYSGIGRDGANLVRTADGDNWQDATAESPE